MSVLKPECDTIGCRSLHTKRDRCENGDQQGGTSRPRTPLLSTQKRYDKLRKLSLRRKNPSEEVMRPMAIQEQQWNKVLLEYGQNQATLLAKKKVLLGRRQLK